MKLIEILNIYDLHDDPKQLKGHDNAYETIPGLVWEKYQRQPEELKKREHILAKDPHIAYTYALFLGKRFPAGEVEIAKHSNWACRYARNIIDGPFKAGEAVIAKNAADSYTYAVKVLEKRFKAGEPAIKKVPATYDNYKYQFGM